MDPIIEMRGVVKIFGTKTAVEGIDITVEQGERVAIIGPNGAGKTTTLLMTLGVIDPDGGTISVAGKRLPSERAAAMSEVGFAAGYLPLPDRLRVIEALEFFGDLYGVANSRAAADRVLEELDVAHLRRELCMNLSSGQRTLIGIAKAVIHKPHVLVLDEPTASLDPDVALRVRDRLQHQSEDHGAAVVLTSHDMREVEALTDRVIFLESGRVIADGPAGEIATAAGFSNLENYFLAVAAARRADTL